MTTFGRIQWRRDQGADWTSVNPILLSGEIGFNLDNGLFKIGDGETPWNGLQYFGASNAFAALLVWDAITSKPAYVAAGPTAAAARAAIGAASTDQLAQAIADLVGASPEHLDTLKELGDAIGEADADLTDLLALVGTKQDADADLTALAGLTGNDQMAYRNASGMWVTTPISSFGRTWVNLADAAAARTALGLVIGTHILAFNQNLDNLTTHLATHSASSSARMLTFVGNTGVWNAFATSSYGRSFLASADIAAAFTYLGLDKVNVRQITGTTDTPTATDTGKTLETTNAAATAITINGAVHAANDYFTVEQYGAGQVSFVAGSGGMVLRSELAKLKIGAQYSGATVRFRSATEAVIVGNLVS